MTADEKLNSLFGEIDTHYVYVNGLVRRGEFEDDENDDENEETENG